MRDFLLGAAIAYLMLAGLYVWATHGAYSWSRFHKHNRHIGG